MEACAILGHVMGGGVATLGGREQVRCASRGVVILHYPQTTRDLHGGDGAGWGIRPAHDMKILPTWADVTEWLNDPASS